MTPSSSGAAEKKCPKWIPFDANGWLSWEDTYCLNCLQEDCPNKPHSPSRGAAERKFQTYLFEYEYDGSTWGFEMKASTPEDAEARVQKLPWARYVGELKATFPIGLGWIAKLICYFQNL